MNCLSLLPSLFKLLTQLNCKTSSVCYNAIECLFLSGLRLKKTPRNGVQKLIISCINLTALLMQSSMLLIVLLSDFLLESAWRIPVSLLLVSISLIKNLFLNSSPNSAENEPKISSAAKFKHFMCKSFKNIENSRQKISLITSLWKIGITLLFAHIYHPKFKFNPSFFEKSVNSMLYLTPLIVHLLASLVFYLACSLAFKLRMQRVCFALPLSLTTPVCLALALVLCHFNFPLKREWLSELRNHFICTSSYFHDPFRWQLVCGMALWWLSHLWTTNPIWNNDANRKAFKNESTQVKRPFKFQNFSSVFIENSIMIESLGDLRHISLNEDENSQSESSSLHKEDRKTETLLCICATIWHENTNEMLQLLKSIMRLDLDQCEKRKRKELDGKDTDCFDYEAHVFFDDAISYGDNGSSEPNGFVQNFIEVVSEAAIYANKCEVSIEPPVKISTPYGGRLVFRLPGGNDLVVHLKDKKKIRNKKRWSQVMYMYYLLGYKYFGSLDEMERHYQNENLFSKAKEDKGNGGFVGYGSLLRSVGDSLRARLENTFILTLDGDVEFRPSAVRLMLDKIKENKKIGLRLSSNS